MVKNSFVLSFVILVSFKMRQVSTHVSLKYPLARMIDLDFLDSARTSGDCGMEAGDSRTTLISGSSLNFTWHLGYPHKGGYRLTLVDPDQGLEKRLVPDIADENSWDTMSGIYAQNHIVTLPSVECDNCYLRFQRQAKEWGKYEFRSCADVKLVSSISGDSKQCSDHGTWVNGQCDCDRLREGDRCQYATQCQTDADCNGPKGQGQCLLVDNVIFPYKECFCADGWFGPQCEHSTRWGPGKAKIFNDEIYEKVDMGSGVELLWKITDTEDEIEMIVSGETTSWLGLGWRPSNIDKSCYNFPETISKYRSARLHAMDCMDVVIGVSKNGLGRVADYYTRDRSTPRLDSVWGGEDDLLSSHAWEEDGRTNMRFIRKLKGGTADHDIGDTMTLIWAHGQSDNFYLDDQLKYHGKTSRGINSLALPAYLSSGSRFSSSELSSVHIGIIVSCLLIAVLLIIQMCQNYDKKMRFLTPYSNKSFTPDH